MVFGLVVVGLLIALVVLGALMYTNMKQMCCTSDQIMNNSKDAQEKLEAAQAKMALVLAPLAIAAAIEQKKAAAAAAAATAAPAAPTQ